MGLSKKQRGMSFIALILLIGIIGYTGFIGMKLIPEYLEFQAVKSSVDSLAAEMETRPLNKSQALNLLKTKLVTGYVEFKELLQPSEDCFSSKAKRQEVFQYNRDKNNIELILRYEKRIKLFANIQVLLNFNYSKKVAVK
jgi:hypothetical protein